MKKIDYSKIVLESRVENYYLQESGKNFIYSPAEKIPVIQVGNFPELGKLTALRFIEWVQNNPDGVISLPTGKTPEHFISWFLHFIKNWDKSEVQDELKKTGINYKIKPELGALNFIQIDEFYPINSTQHNSFYYYVQNYYIKKFGLNEKKALLMNINEIGTAEGLPLNRIFPDRIVDLSLRTRYASNRLERLQKETIEIVDQFCTDYESKIRDMGGIGFFLGGIGPDGHIGFNVRGSDHFSTTRLINTNYETQAAAAGDLGGMEIARNSLVITIGLDTITYNPNATAIIIAAGEAKANIVRDSVEHDKNNRYPATALQKLKNARFYLTNGAALRLMSRRLEDAKNEEPLSERTIERAVFNLAVEKNKTLKELNAEDFAGDIFGQLVIEKTGIKAEELAADIYNKVVKRLEHGMTHVDNQVILHTEPHHDDIMLGYLPFINHLVRTINNKHHFVTLTSGFTAVTNAYMLELIEDLKWHLENNIFSKKIAAQYFNPEFQEGRDRDVNLYLDGVASHSRTLKSEAVSRRLLRNLIELFDESDVSYLNDRINELINYFRTQYPGKRDIPYVQRLKGMMREFEVEILWGLYGFSSKDVSHLRLGFYQGKIFTENPDVDRDVLPVLDLYRKVKPTVITVALDPEGSGPDTHYKVLQVVSEALKLYADETDISNIKIWGYRNVWYKFHPAEANLYIPMSINSMSILENAFLQSFGSQKAASFPSWEYDGPFGRLATQIQEKQYQIIRNCLGKDYFLKHDIPRARAAHGMLFLKEMTVDEFHEHSMELKKVTERI